MMKITQKKLNNKNKILFNNYIKINIKKKKY